MSIFQDKTFQVPILGLLPRFPTFKPSQFEVIIRKGDFTLIIFDYAPMRMTCKDWDIAIRVSEKRKQIFDISRDIPFWYEVDIKFRHLELGIVKQNCIRVNLF